MIAAAPIVLEATAEVADDAVGYRTATPRIPRRMALPELGADLRIRPRPHSVSDSPSIFDAPRTFPE